MLLTAQRARAVPRLRTPRALITLLDEADAHLSQAYYLKNREHLARWEPARTDHFYTLAAARDRAEISRTQYQLGQSVLFCALDPAGAEMIASCHLSNIRYGATLACNLGFSVSQDHQGSGLMHEVASEVIRYAFESLRLHRICASHMPDNDRSARLLTRLGFERIGLARSQIRIAGQWEDHMTMQLINPADA